MQTTRRRFLASAALVGAGRRLEAAEPALRFPTVPRERLAIASYSLRSLIDSPRRRTAGKGAAGPMDIKDVPAFVVKQFDIRKVEILGQHLGSTEAAYLDEYRRALASAGVQVVNIPTGIGASLYDPDAGR